MIGLDEADYKKIIFFTTELMNTQENFETTVLKLFEELFGIKHSIFSYTKKDVFYKVVGNNIDEDVLNEMVQYYENAYVRNQKDSDSYVNKLIEYEKQNFDNLVYASNFDIISSSEFEKSEYYRILEKENLYYEIVLYLNNVSYSDERIFLAIFKQKKDVCFSERERHLLTYLSQVISNMIKNRRKQNDYLDKTNLMISSMANIPVGFMILDSDFKFINYNKKIIDLMIGITKEASLELATKKILKIVTQNDKYTNLNIISEKEIEYNGYNIKLTPTTIINCSENIETDYTLVISDMTDNKLDDISKKKSITFSDKFSLKQREFEVLELMVEGLSYKQIAAKLYISIHTVNTYVDSLYKKLDVNNRAKAISIYFEETK